MLLIHSTTKSSHLLLINPHHGNHHEDLFCMKSVSPLYRYSRNYISSAVNAHYDLCLRHLCSLGNPG